jgi:hypothetical protein
MANDRKRKVEDRYSENETQRRFETALRGARIAGPKHKESMTPKRRGPQQRRIKKAKV